MTDWLNTLTEGRVCHFDLLAWPSKKIPNDGEETVAAVCRVPRQNVLRGWHERGKSRMVFPF